MYLGTKNLRHAMRPFARTNRLIRRIDNWRLSLKAKKGGWDLDLFFDLKHYLQDWEDLEKDPNLHDLDSLRDEIDRIVVLADYSNVCRKRLAGYMSHLAEDILDPSRYGSTFMQDNPDHEDRYEFPWNKEDDETCA